MRTRVWQLVGTTIATAIFALASTPARAQDDPEGAQTASLTAVNLHATFLPGSIARDQSAGGGGSSSSSSSSSNHSEGFGIGIKGGFPYASVSGTTGLQRKAGWAIGIWFGGNHGGTVGVMGELLYVKRSISDGVNTADAYSLFIPIFLRINFGSHKENGIQGYVIGGPVVDLQLKQKLNGADVAGSSKGVDIDVAFGGGLEVYRFIAELRYVIGIRSIVFNHLVITKSEDRTFFLLFGFRFN